MKQFKTFICQSCGSVFPKWSGKCDECGNWNTITEELTPSSLKNNQKLQVSEIEFEGLSAEASAESLSYFTNIEEFDRVCGGGLHAGAVILIGGDPGIGKSTLLLQAAAALSQTSPTSYLSGEEGTEQIRKRAKRLGLQEAPLKLAHTTTLEPILKLMGQQDSPKILVIDSIQTLHSSVLDSAPGTVSQVRTAAHELIKKAKEKKITLFLIGHVTKEGAIAGPRLLEHMVDTVLYFEGDRTHNFRLLRSIKNRFGATDEIGVFEMRESGLSDIKNPSSYLLEDHVHGESGSSIFPAIEGTRPLLLEVQALVTPSHGTIPKRTAVGFDLNRLMMILAVLEKKCNIPFGSKDVFLNIVGGIRVQEPAADLAVAASILSSYGNIPLPSKSIFIGEVGLSGEVRSVSHLENRLKEGKKLGFEKSILSARATKMKNLPLEAYPVHNIGELMNYIKGLNNDH